MKFFEFNSSGVLEKLSNIKNLLTVTNNSKLLDFAEKQIETHTGQTEAMMNNEQRIDAIVSALKESNDPSLINYIEGVLRKTELSERVEKLWNTRGWTTGRMIKYKESFKKEIIDSQSPLLDKIQFLFLVTSNKTAIESNVFTKSFKGTLDSIIPSKIAQNKTFQDIKKTIFFDDRFRGKGIGPGEFALSLLGKQGNIVDHRGDVEISGWGIEIKHGGGGSIKTGSPTKFRMADKLRAWIGDEVGVDLNPVMVKRGRTEVNKNKLNWDSDNEFTQKYKSLNNQKKQEITKKYVEELYPELGSDEQKILINGIIEDAGTPQVRKHFGEALLSAYKKQDDWDCILFMHPNGALSNVVDISQTEEFLDFNLAGINRDGDTQALPDGYVNGKVLK